MSPKSIKTISSALLGLLLFLAVLILFRLYAGSEVPTQFAGALLGAIVTAAITMALLHGQTQAEETKERNVKVFEEKTRRYNDFLKKLWTVWQDRHVTLEELNELMELVSQDIIIYTKAENTQKLLRSLTRIAAHAGKPHTSDEEQKEVQREVFEIINTLAEEINLGGRINEAIRKDLNVLEDKVRPFLIAKEYRKKLLDEVGEVLNRAELPLDLSKPYYEEWAGNEYLWTKVDGGPVELGIGPVSNKNGTEGYFIGFFAEFYSHREFQKFRNAQKGFRKDFLGWMKWEPAMAAALPNFNDPESISGWAKKYATASGESPGSLVGTQLIQYAQEWKHEGRDIKSIIDECRAPKPQTAAYQPDEIPS